MKTRHWAIALLALALVGGSGCGTWSNADIQFLYALPSRDQLKVVVPSQVAESEQGLGTRRDGLALNEPSTVHAWTRNAADSMNNSIFSLLEILERAKQLNPSTRADDYREWGPFRDKVGVIEREVRLVIQRYQAPAEHFEWRIEVRRLRDSEWLEAISGTYQPTEDLRHGVGEFSLQSERVRRANLAGPGDDPNLRQLVVRYATDADPLHIEVDLVAANGTLAYVYDEYSDHSGSMRFDVTADWLAMHEGGTAAKETLKVTTRWVSTGAGRADLLVTGGDVGTAEVDGGAECWDAAFNVVYGRENWDSDHDGTRELIGDPAACAIQP